jgi:hypothetical protein
MLYGRARAPGRARTPRPGRVWEAPLNGSRKLKLMAARAAVATSKLSANLPG